MANEFKVKNGVITPTLQSTVATGTAPLTVSSTTLVSNLNADLLDGNHASAFAAASHGHNIIGYQDTRGTNINPYSYAGVSLHLKTNTTDGLADGGTYHGVLNLTQWGDSSGGRAHQLGFTDNQNLYYRTTNDGTNFSTWNKIWHAGNDGSGSGLDADTLDGYDSSFFKIKYTAIVRRAVWSRIAKLEVEQLFGSLYVTFRHTRNSVVVGNTLLVTFGHYGHGQLVLLGSHGYSQVEVRVVGDGTGNNVYLEILDNNTSDGTDDNDYTVTLDNINCTVTKYTTFTDGTQASPPIYSSITTANNEIILDGNKVWHQGNDGGGSGLDADLLDGNHASAFALSGHTHSYYIGTTQVQTSSANQAVTGITSVTGGTGNTDLGIYTSDATATNTNTGILRVATGNALSGNASSGALALYTGSAQGSSSAGLVSIYAGDSGPSAASGGNVTIVGGSVSAPTSTGGYVLIRGGTALTGASTAGTGGSVHLVGGYAYAASGTKIGGNVYLEGGAPFNAGTNTNGSVYLGTNAAAINNSGTAAVYIGSSSITTTITGTVKLPTVGTSGFVKLGTGGQLSADTNTYLTSESDTLATVTGRGATTSSAISITNTTQSTSTTTGALIVSGGLGIAKAVYVGGGVTASGNISTSLSVSCFDNNVADSVYVGDLASRSTSKYDFDVTGGVILHTLSFGIETGAKLLVEIVRDSDGAKRMSEVLVLMGDSAQSPTVKFTEYAVLTIGADNIGYCEAVVNGTNVNVQFVRTGTWSTQNCTWKTILLGTMSLV